MYSISIDYIFNRIYDVLLWIKYVWVFGILRKDPEVYLDENKNSVFNSFNRRIRLCGKRPDQNAENRAPAFFRRR